MAIKINRIYTLVIGLCTLLLQGMDYLITPLHSDVVESIIKHIPIPFADCNVKKQLQIISSLREISKTWNSFLTVPKICMIANFDPFELATFECQRAGNMNLMHTQLRASQKNNDQSISEPAYALKNELKEQFKAMKFFLESGMIDPNLPLLIDEQRYLEDSQEEICQTKKVAKHDLELTDTKGMIFLPLLHYALRCGAHTTFIELLLKAGSAVNEDVYDDHTIRTPLYVHVLYNNYSCGQSYEKAQILIAHGANPNACDQEDNTLLHSLVLSNCKHELRINAIEQLQFYGADCTIANKAGERVSDVNLDMRTRWIPGIRGKIVFALLQAMQKIVFTFYKKLT